MCTKVVLADDHHLIRAALRTQLEKELGMMVLAEAGDGQTVVEQVREHSPDIVIMDINMPGLDGIAATRIILEEFPSVKIIALSMHGNKLFVEDMFNAGASAYLLKSSAPDELSIAIQTVLADEIYISPKVADIVIKTGKKRPPSPSNSTTVLTKRECEVLQLLAEGKSTKQIATQFNKSIQTIDTTRRQIMAKLDIDNMAGLVKYAIREGLTGFDL